MGFAPRADRSLFCFSDSARLFLIGQAMKSHVCEWLLVIVCLLVSLEDTAGHTTSVDQAVPAVETATLGDTNNVHRVGWLFLSGQFTPADIEAIKEANITRVITLRKPEELKWDEKVAIEAAGLHWFEFPFREPAELSDDVFDQARKLLRESGQTRTLLHCGTANRVGGVWLAYRVLDQQVNWDAALAEAKTIGLKNDAYIARAKEYVESHASQSAISPDLNRDFLDPSLDVDSWISRFEVESREVFVGRLEILKQCGIQPGFKVADVGAGTGLFTRLIANEVNSDGHVFAVEISPAFLLHINRMAKELGLQNVTSVLCREDSVGLPAESIDMAFVCDTYHHFAFPQATLESIYQSLRPGGSLIVVDFERIPNQSREWVISHVRAGKEVVQAEIEAAGFQFIDEPNVPELEENYLLRFRRPESSK